MILVERLPCHSGKSTGLSVLRFTIVDGITISEFEKILLFFFQILQALILVLKSIHMVKIQEIVAKNQTETTYPAVTSKLKRTKLTAYVASLTS